MNGSGQFRRKGDLPRVEGGMHVVNQGEPVLPNPHMAEGAPLVERKINNPSQGVFAIIDGSPSSAGRAAIIATITAEHLALELGNRLDQGLDRLSQVTDIDRRRTQMEECIAAQMRTAVKTVNGLMVNTNRQRGGGPDRATMVSAKVFEVALGEHRLALANIGAHRAYLWDGKTLQRLTEDDREPAGRQHLGSVTEFIGDGEKANEVPVKFLSVEPGNRILLISEDTARLSEDALRQALIVSRRTADAERAIQDKADALARDPRYGSETSGGFAAVIYEIPVPKEQKSHPPPEKATERTDVERWRHAMPLLESRLREVDLALEKRLHERRHAKEWTPEYRRMQERLIAETRRERAEHELALADLRVKRARSLIPPRFKGSEKVTFKPSQESSLSGEIEHAFEVTVRSFDETTDMYTVEVKGEPVRVPRFQLESWQSVMDLPMRFGDRFVLNDGMHPEAEVRYIGLDAGRSAVQVQWPDGKMGWTTVLSAQEALQQEIHDAREAQLEKVTQQKIIDTVTHKAA